MAPTNATKPAVVAETVASLHVDGTAHELIHIKASGDVVLDVTFENTNACTKSIPSDVIHKLRASGSAIPSARVFFRVQLDTLKKVSKYFRHLLGSDVFGEGRATADALKKLANANLNPSEIEAARLPRIKIVDEDDATRTLGRESVFRDMLRIVHGNAFIKPITVTYLSVLVTMADRYDCMNPVQRYVTTNSSKFNYPATVDKSSEEILRQKILIFYHTDQASRLATATKELILLGSSRWMGYNDGPGFTTAWWSLPGSLEAELAHRRACILRTLSSIQSHFLDLYTSKTRQCSLGYDSSPACDSFQLGEMIKFLTKKNLLSLIPFQAASPFDADYVWPEAYSGNIESIIASLRQCPSYQIDKNHGHCGLRSRLLPMLDYVKILTDGSVGIRISTWKKDRAAQSWIIGKKGKESRSERRPFVVGGKAVGEDDQPRVFDFTQLSSSSLMWNEKSLNSSYDTAAKNLFTAQKWCWTAETEADGKGLPKNSPSWKF